MRNSFCITICLIYFICCPLFATAHTDEMYVASFVTSEQIQPTGWNQIGEIAAFLNGSASNKKTFYLYASKESEAVYKIEDYPHKYIITPNPSYSPEYNSGKKSFEYVAGNYYLNLSPKNIQAQKTNDWNKIGEITAFLNGSTSNKKTFYLYASKEGEAVYKIEDYPHKYIITPNPSYSPEYDSGKKSFEYVAGNYYLNLSPKNIQAQKTNDWNKIGEITAFLNGSTSNKKTFYLYASKEGEAVYKIKDYPHEYIITPNPLHDPEYNSGKKSFKYVAGDYYLDLSL